MISRVDLERYMSDRHAFRREQIVLPNGKLLGDVEEIWQTEHVFAPIDAHDGTDWRYRLIYLELHRGAAKTAALAAEALTDAILEEDIHGYFCAGDKEQASRGFEMLTGFIQRNPGLRNSFRITKDEVVVPATNARIKVLSSDAPTAYGLGGLSRRFRLYADELWQWQGRDLWDAMFTAAPKSEDWRVFVGSNAGFDTSSVAWEVRELCRTEADPRYYLYSPDGVVAGWIKPEDIEAQRNSLPPAVFQRLWENRWTEGSGSFVTRDQLNRCIDPTWKPQLLARDRSRFFVGLDLGLVRDRTARAVCHYDRDADRVVLDDLRVWQGTPDQPVAIADIEQDLLDCDHRFNRPEFVLDPWELRGTIQKLTGSLRIKEFKFGAETVRRLSESLYGLITNAQLRLYPDAELERELLQLEAKQTSYGWRIDHTSSGFSDRAMAVAMAAMHAAMEGNRPHSPLLCCSEGVGCCVGGDDWGRRIRRAESHARMSAEDPEQAVAREAARIAEEEEERARERRVNEHVAALERAARALPAFGLTPDEREEARREAEKGVSR